MEKIDERYGVHLFSAGLRRWHAIRRSTFINLTFGVIILSMAYYTEIFSVRAIAIILQYGHGTGNGGYVQGIDYINPALKPIFDELAEKVWKEVTNH